MKFIERSHFRSIFAKTTDSVKDYKLNKADFGDLNLNKFFSDKFRELMNEHHLNTTEFANIYYPYMLASKPCSVSKMSRLLDYEGFTDLPGLVGLLRVSYYFNLPFSYWMPDSFEERVSKVKDIRTEKIVAMLELLPLKKHQQMVKWIQSEIAEFEADSLQVCKCPVQWTDGVSSAFVSQAIFEERLFQVLTFLNIQVKTLENEADFNTNTFYQRNYRRSKKVLEGEETNENVFGIRTREFINLCMSIGVSPDYMLGTKWQLEHIKDDDADTEMLKRMVMRLPYCSVCTLMTMLYNESAKKERQIIPLSDEEKNTFGYVDSKTAPKD